MKQMKKSKRQNKGAKHGIRHTAPSKHDRMRNSLRKAPPMKRKTKKTNPPRSRKHPVRRMKLHIRRPTTARQYHALSQKQRETWDSVAHVISRMRDRVSLAKASEEFGIAPSIVVEFGRPALRKRNARYVATKTDHLLRVITTLGVMGKTEIATRDSRQASLVGGHWAGVQRYLQTGDDSALLRFKGKKVTDTAGKRHLLLTDLKEVDRQAAAGVLSFESMYAGGAR